MQWNEIGLELELEWNRMKIPFHSTFQFQFHFISTSFQFRFHYNSILITFHNEIMERNGIGLELHGMEQN